MSTLFFVVALLLLGCIVLSAVATVAVLLIHLWRWARRSDPPFEPAAAEAPDSDKAFADVQRVLGPPVVDSHHARCGGPCCAAEHLDELVVEFDWHAAEHMMRRAR